MDRTDNKVESFFHHEVFPRPACPSILSSDRPSSSASSSRCFLPHPPSCSWPSERAFYGAAGCIFDHLSLSLLFSSFLRSSAEFGGSGILGEKQKEGQARARKVGYCERGGAEISSDCHGALLLIIPSFVALDCHMLWVRSHEHARDGSSLIPFANVGR